MSKTGIFFIVEAGPLEELAKILVLSLKKNGGLANTEVFAYRPRRGPKLRQSTVDFLESNEIEILEKRLNQSLDFYPLANKPAAASHFESTYGSRFERLIFLDSDLFICAPLSKIKLPAKWQIAMRPWIQDHLKGLPQAKVREKILRGAFPDLEAGCVKEAGEKKFNTGVIVSKPDTGVFQTWNERLRRVLTDRRVTNMKGLNFYFLEESVLGYAAHLCCKDQTVPLDPLDNGPVTRPLQEATGVHPKDIRILHYHSIPLLFADAQRYEAVDASLEEIISLVDTNHQRPIWYRPYEIMRFQKHKLKLLFGLK